MSPKSHHRVNMQKLYETLELFVSKLDLSKFNDAVNYIHDIKTQFSNNPDEYDSFVKTLIGITEARLSYDGDIVTLQEIQQSDVERIRAKLQGQRDLLVTFDTYLPPEYKSDHCDIETEKVFSDDEIRSLNKFSDNSKPSAVKQVKRKLRKIIFEELSACDNDDDKARKIRTVLDSFLEKVSDSLPESTNNDILRSHYKDSVEKLENTIEKVEKQENFLGFVGDLKHHLKQCENITVKQRMLHKIDEKEEILNKIEDDQLQLNLLIEWFKSAIIYAEFLLERKQTGENFDQNKMGEEEQQKLAHEKLGEEEQLKKELNEHNKKIFETLFIRCLEMIDGDSIFEELYEENPKEALPVILRRFQRKLKEFQAFKEEYDRTCREAYEEHFSSNKKENS